MLPDSFQPYLLNKAINNTVNFTTSGDTSLLTAGQLGIYTCPPSSGVEGNAISTGTTTPCIIASGSWYTADFISPLWGGLQEPDRTQIIDWTKVNAFWYTQAQPLQNQVSVFGWNLTSGSTLGPAFSCGTSYQFQLQLQGAPALEFLNHTYYKSLTAFSGCCGTGCTSGCTSTNVDAACVMLQWKDQINQDPYWPSFINSQVFIQTSAGTAVEVFSAYDIANNRGVGQGAYVCNTSNPISVVAGLQITVAYLQTNFGNCTFSPTDYYTVEPLYVQGSLFTQTADPCAVNTTIDTSVPNMWTQIVAPAQVRGIGEQVVRNLIEWGRYKQEDFPDSQWTGSLRMREIELYWELNAVTRSALYDSIVLKYNKYRPWNATGVYDNDEYALTVYFPTGTVITPFTNIINSCLSAVNNSVQMVTV